MIWQSRFLSAFLKVNPYFTVVMAVGFSGIAAVGFKDTDMAKSLTKLIPLHIQSMQAKPPAGLIVEGLPDARQMREIICNGSVSSACGLNFGYGSFENILFPYKPKYLGQAKTNKTDVRRKSDLTRSHKFLWFGLPEDLHRENFGQPRVHTDPELKETAESPPDQQPQPGNWLGPVFFGLASAKLDPAPPLSSIAPSAPAKEADIQEAAVVLADVVLADSVPLAIGTTDMPDDRIILPPTDWISGPLPDQGTDVFTVDLVEPPMAIVFAAMLLLLFKLCRRASIRIAG